MLVKMQKKYEKQEKGAFNKQTNKKKKYIYNTYKYTQVAKII